MRPDLFGSVFWYNSIESHLKRRTSVPALTFTDMFKTVKDEAIVRMKTSQENIKEIEVKIREALDAGDSENFEIHKLSKESNLKTLDAHKTLVLELNETLNKGGDDRALPSVTSIKAMNPSDIEITLGATSGKKTLKLTVKTDMYGLLKHRPFYGFEKTDPEVKDQAELDILQAATGFVLRGYIETFPAIDLAKRFKDLFVGKPVERTGSEKSISCSAIDKSGDQICISFDYADKQSEMTKIPESSTIVMDRDQRHIWWSEEPITPDKSNRFQHLLSLS